MCKGIISQDEETIFLKLNLTSVSSLCALHCFLLDKLKLKLLFASVKHKKHLKKARLYCVCIGTLDFFFMFSKTPMNIYISINFCAIFVHVFFFIFLEYFSLRLAAQNTQSAVL
jgi:hypothetical protein